MKFLKKNPKKADTFVTLLLITIFIITLCSSYWDIIGISYAGGFSNDSRYIKSIYVSDALGILLMPLLYLYVWKIFYKNHLN
jgi:hypothetical protein